MRMELRTHHSKLLFIKKKMGWASGFDSPAFNKWKWMLQTLMESPFEDFFWFGCSFVSNNIHIIQTFEIYLCFSYEQFCINRTKGHINCWRCNYYRHVAAPGACRFHIGTVSVRSVSFDEFLYLVRSMPMTHFE